MENTATLQELKSKLKLLIRLAAEDRIRKHANHAEFKIIEDQQFTPGQVLGNWMSLILVTGSALKITLKFHFSNKDIKQIIYPLYHAGKPDDVSDKQAMDFMKEFSNLTAGYIEQSFERMDVPLGISLPLGTRGFYEVFADYQETDKPVLRFNDLWCLMFEQIRIYATVMIEVSDIDALKHLDAFDPIQAEEDEDEGEFDFL